ncbi:MAG: FtsX-like permease family protein [Roseivirga sp.]|nr:FtsX-like permease family protein [Roseivirga sp.]
MLSNYFITILRQIQRKPGFYILNISGLAVGLASFVLMFQYVSYELSFDRFHDHAEDIYRLNFNYQLPGSPLYEGAAVFAGVGPALKKEFPQVESTTRLVSIWGGGGVVRFGENRLSVPEIQYAEGSFFDIFSFDLLQGSRENALKDVHTALISENLRARLFEGEKGMGELVELQTRDGLQNYLITGVYDLKANSHYTSDLLLSFSSLEQLLGFSLDSHWAWFDYITYVKLREGTDAETLEGQFPAMIDKYATGRNRNSETMGFSLMPLTDIHLHSHINQEIVANGDYQTVIFLLIIGVLILTIAWINYINLYTAKATERGKEVGVRKTLGAGKGQLRTQLLLEALVINFLAVVMALFLVKFTIPLLGEATGMSIPTDFFAKPGFWLRITLLWLVGSLLSGFYPALLISNYAPLMAIRSVALTSSGTMRKVLVVWQFMASAALVVGAATVYHQLTEMNEQPLGIDTESVLVLSIPQFTTDHSQYYQALNSLKEELLTFGGVEGVSYASDVPGKQVGWRGSSQLIGPGNEEGTGLVYKMVIGQDYLSLYDIDLLAGRNFERVSDSSSVILNARSLPLYGFNSSEESLNRRIYFPGVDTLTVIGVVEDYYQESLKEPIKPTAYLQMEEELMYLFVRLPESQLPDFLVFAEQRFEEVFPALPFDYQPIEDKLALRHAHENSFLKAFNIFVLLSFFISSLGLVGLASYMARKRQKEIGLRKVLGSSVQNVIVLFFKDFTKLAVLGNLMALPLVYYGANLWLDQFAFRTSFLWWLPIIALGISLVLAFLSTLYHILRVARVNPASVLNHQ